ncbi:hypothetical protein DMA11_03555 [Marinilabiliaceae bacterium JC017]|nr:hypothetical protein DMA11_03555 [Marinilabiliaceae bacterium JC017]
MSSIERQYRLTDAKLLEHAETIALILPGDILSFHRFNATITTEYPTSIKKAILEVKAIKSDCTIRSEIGESTQQVKTLMRSCHATFKTIRFFVKKRFPNHSHIHQQFGLADFHSIRKHQLKLTLFMELLASTAESRRNELIEAGCPTTEIDHLATLASQLNSANIEQEALKKERLLLTQDRITKLNDLFLRLMNLSKMALIIFKDDPARRATYVMSPNRHKA